MTFPSWEAPLLGDCFSSPISPKLNHAIKNPFTVDIDRLQFSTRVIAMTSFKGGRYESRIQNERAAQPSCSSQALRRSRRAGGGRRSPSDSRPGEVRVRVLASGLEYTDVVIRRHLYAQTMRRRPPFVLGYDVIGEIDQLGDGVSGFQLGDRVADMTVLGSNAAYRTLRASDLTRVPADVDAAEVAALILSWTTAYQLLHRAAHVQRGERVLVQGAAGAVGQALLVLGRLDGLELWGTARGGHAALIRELGATPIDYQREDFTRVLPGGFDVVFDGIGEDGYRRSYA